MSRSPSSESSNLRLLGDAAGETAGSEGRIVRRVSFAEQNISWPVDRDLAGTVGPQTCMRWLVIYPSVTCFRTRDPTLRSRAARSGSVDTAETFESVNLFDMYLSSVSTRLGLDYIVSVRGD